MICRNKKKNYNESGTKETDLQFASCFLGVEESQINPATLELIIVRFGWSLCCESTRKGMTAARADQTEMEERVEMLLILIAFQLMGKRFCA